MTRQTTCPICRKEVAPPPPPPAEGALKSSYPFCSERCRMVDLGRWLTGQYAIPGDPTPDDRDEGEPRP